ncbi:MAG: fibrobacter succinogenes major paralogous domain-containing protein, partial [Fibrobacter sp.]|nr:fibrobacter succinogenes major paralogous domain-containing protein [Fibrobacter sp.]
GRSESAEESSSSVKLSSSSVILSEVEGILTDSRDGQTYKTVVIGSQTWMAQNLNYVRAGSYCYMDASFYCAEYGRLYTWNAARTACPSGWHLPSKDEFEMLFSAVGGQSIAGKMLKSTSVNGTDAYSFSALLAGLRFNGGYFTDMGHYAHFWSSTEYKYDNNNAYNMYLHNSEDNAHLPDYSKDLGFSVRCVKD